MHISDKINNAINKSSAYKDDAQPIKKGGIKKFFTYIKNALGINTPLTRLAPYYANDQVMINKKLAQKLVKLFNSTTQQQDVKTPAIDEKEMYLSPSKRIAKMQGKASFLIPSQTIVANIKDIDTKINDSNADKVAINLSTLDYMYDAECLSAWLKLQINNDLDISGELDFLKNKSQTIVANIKDIDTKINDSNADKVAINLSTLDDMYDAECLSAWLKLQINNDLDISGELDFLKNKRRYDETYF